MEGRIKRLVSDKGYGFIRADDGTEYFFHRSAVGAGVDFDTLRQGDRVQFTEEDGNKGPRAVDVELATANN